jgi:hypothetical protein
MKFYLTVLVVLSLSILAMAGKTYTSDPLTGLPVIPTPDRLHLGNEPQKIPSTMCKSKMQIDFFSTDGIKFNDTVAWYNARLSGFKHIHNYVQDRAHDAFYKPDGTVMVSITADRGKDGENVDTHSVSFVTFQPPVSEQLIIGSNSGHTVCP